MNNIRQFPSKSARYDDASAWVARLDRGLSEQETAELAAWLAASSENRAVLLAMAAQWDRMDALSRLADLFPVPAQHRRRLLAPAFAVAAMLIMAVAAGLWAAFEASMPDTPERALGESLVDAYETAVGEQSSVMLSDGTLVVLNTNSRLRVLFTDDYRLLLLDRGEANVQVARDASRPLSLVAADKVFQAVGTAFNVEINDRQKIELVVTEGRVRVGVRQQANQPGKVQQPELLDESAVIVGAGQAWVLSDNSEIIARVSPEDIEVRLSWRDGDLIFRGEPLEEAVREIGRYTSVEFVILDEELKKVRVAGLFKAGDVDGLLVALRENFNIVHERVDERTVFLDTL
jgi:transmembrane sensor